MRTWLTGRANKSLFKLMGPDGLVEEYTVENPEDLKKATVGDLVVITNTETMAISVEKTVAE